MQKVVDPKVYAGIRFGSIGFANALNPSDNILLCSA